MPGTPRRHEDFFGAYPPDRAVIADVRRSFSHWMQDWLEDPEVHNDMVVVLSELVANAVAATANPLGDLTVQAWVDWKALRLKVTNPPASAFGAVNRCDYTDTLRPDGRGLLIVESLVDDLTITTPTEAEPLSVCCGRELLLRP